MSCKRICAKVDFIYKYVQLSINSWANLFNKWLPQWPLNHFSTTASKQPNSFLNHLLHCFINPLLSSFHAHYLLFLPLNISFHPSKILHPEPPISLWPSPFFPLSPLHSPSFLSPPIFCWPLRGSVFGVCVCLCVCVCVCVCVWLGGGRVWNNLLLFPGGLPPRGVSTGG